MTDRTSRALLLALLCGACGPGRPAAPPSAPVTTCDCPMGAEPAPDASPDPGSFMITHAALRKQGASDAFIAKLEQDRFRYFRMLAGAFESRVCKIFELQLPSIPIIVIHGDPHVGQFVVTANTYGLEDFDRGGFGPAVLDLVRYAASLHVTCSEASWDCDPDAAVRAFLDAYEAALKADPSGATPPAVVERLRRRAPSERLAWLDWTETLTTPLEPNFEKEVRSHFAGFGASMAQMHPDVPPNAFEIEAIGSLGMGVGSRLERKLLVRAAGPTASKEDDIVFEIREESPTPEESCVWRPPHGESIQLMIIAVLSRRMPDYHGYMSVAPDWRTAWVQAWDPGYMELSPSDIVSQSELEELARDAGGQLGGHLWNRFPKPLLEYQLFRQRESTRQVRGQVEDLAKRLADESLAEWTRFASEHR